MNTFLVLLTYGVLSIGTANAAPYLDLGIGAAIDVNESRGRNCIRDYTPKGWGCSSNPLGYVAIGYKHRGFSIEASHWSSITTYDAGLNVISIKKRLQF